MQIVLQPCHIVLAALVGRANERQQRIIEFQNDQIEALLKKPGKKFRKVNQVNSQLRHSLCRSKNYVTVKIEPDVATRTQ
jgi:hypothetical protein